MTAYEESLAEDLRFAKTLRSRTRRARNGHWFALVVFGVLVLGSMPFYLAPTLSPRSRGCRAVGGSGFVCSFGSHPAPLGGGLGSPMYPWAPLSRWATVYWTAAIVSGTLLVLLYYRRRSASMGVRIRVWPFAVVGVGLVAVAVGFRGQAIDPRIADFWIRGLQALIVVAVGLLVLAAIERSRTLGLFAVGFFGLALLSCLYDDVNLMQRIGLGSWFRGGAELLPNLVVPGVYLLLGGIGYFVSQRFGWRLRIGLVRVSEDHPTI